MGSDAPVALSIDASAAASLSGNVITIDADAPEGTKFNLTAKCGDITVTTLIEVNDPPVGVKSEISGLPAICESNQRFSPEFNVTDQYDKVSAPADTRWTVTPADGAEVSDSGSVTFSRAGKFTVKASSDKLGASAEVSLIVTPALPLVSQGAKVLASSCENVGTMPENINDGDISTRWGSKHTDNEWVSLDLGGEYMISRVSLIWEAAFASKYELQVAPADAPTRKITVDYGGKHEIDVPVDDAWITAATVSNSSAGEKMTRINADGKYRYVRMLGLERGSAYGYSAYEMKVYGLDANTAPDALIGIQLNLPETTDSGSTVTLNPVGFTLTGDAVNISDVKYSADKEASFGKNTFTPKASGLYTITAVTPEGFSGAAMIFVNDVERPAAVTLLSNAYVAPENDALYIPFTVNNQFLAPYGGDAADLEITVSDAAGNPTSDCHYDSASMTFTAEKCGEYTIDFASLASCKVSVVPASEVNLALGKSAWDSSHENDGLMASFAVDGTRSTRWGSKFNDNEWMIVDLGKPYMLDTARIFWNNPAYATHYTISVSQSEDEDSFTEIDRREGYKWSEAPEIHTLAGNVARYVKITGLKRSTGYGTSIDELEIYGRPLTTGADEIYSEDISDTDSDTEWYNLQGVRIPRPAAPGLYIRKTRTATSKILIH